MGLKVEMGRERRRRGRRGEEKMREGGGDLEMRCDAMRCDSVIIVGQSKCKSTAEDASTNGISN